MDDLLKGSETTSEFPIGNIDDANNVLRHFSNNVIAVLSTNKATNISPGAHYHDDYEFIICYSDLPLSIIDNKLYNIRTNTLTAINPMQEHGSAEEVKGFNVCGIHIDKFYLQSIAKSIYGSTNIQFSNESFACNHDLRFLISLFEEELKYKQTGYEFMIENLSELIVGSLIRQLKHNLPYKPHNISKYVKENIKKAIDYMNENYIVGVSCAELSKLIKMDKYSFIRIFKAQTNKTPYEYLLDLKIEKAKKMLESNIYTITEISMLCGFSSHSHFTSTFKKKTGLSPTDYKKDF